MADCAFDDFRGDVVGSAAQREVLLAGAVELSGETKVSDFDLEVISEEEVGKRQVSVEDGVSMQVGYPVYYLGHKPAH